MSNDVARPRLGRPRVLEDDAILEVALEWFSRRGFEGVSVRALARELGIVHGTANQRFGTKEGLYYAAVDHGFGGLDEEMRGRNLAASETSDDLINLRNGMSSYLAAMMRRPALTRLLARESLEASARLDYIWQQYMAPYVTGVDRAIERLVAAGRVRPVSAELVFSLMYGLAAPWATLPALTSKFESSGEPVDTQLAADLIIRAISTARLDGNRPDAH